MAHLKIRNIGPVTDIDIELNRFNVIIGPQSSGKSTIAKIISFCQWLEKDCLMRQNLSHINDEFARKSLFDYHNIAGYINGNSEFNYSGTVLDIEFNRFSLKATRKDGFSDAMISKNAYIPSDRNVLAVPGIFSTRMPENYLSSFIDDWQTIRTKFQNDESVGILDLGDSYFFDKSAKSDMLRLHTGKSITLSEASSGLQSESCNLSYTFH